MPLGLLQLLPSVSAQTLPALPGSTRHRARYSLDRRQRWRWPPAPVALQHYPVLLKGRDCGYSAPALQRPIPLDKLLASVPTHPLDRRRYCRWSPAPVALQHDLALLKGRDCGYSAPALQRPMPLDKLLVSVPTHLLDRRRLKVTISFRRPAARPRRPVLPKGERLRLYRTCTPAADAAR